MRRRRLALAGAVLAAGLALLAVVARPADAPPLRRVRGVLLEVRASSILYAQRVTLRADDGRILAFEVDPEVATNRDEPQSASHLRQHMAFGDPVVVLFRDEQAGPVAIRIQDAP